MTHRREYGQLQVNFFQNMLEELDSQISSRSLLLDFGCGEGWTVYQFIDV